MSDTAPDTAFSASTTRTSHSTSEPGTLTAASRNRRGAGIRERRLLERLQSLEDAIAYRSSRVAVGCPDCGPPPGMCDDHACDLKLISRYQRTHHQTASQLRAICQELRQPGRRSAPTLAATGTARPRRPV
jgi:hypothetical protein